MIKNGMVVLNLILVSLAALTSARPDFEIVKAQLVRADTSVNFAPKTVEIPSAAAISLPAQPVVEVVVPTKPTISLSAPVVASGIAAAPSVVQ
ncbi:hypothetical protein SK128_022991 [Halocaridina rubra]|uniref:Uncharacterized protein n=1 Tax=Halocaridina rubra TaxID=373956 RepID=A0AAN9A5P0_HALRR